MTLKTTSKTSRVTEGRAHGPGTPLHLSVTLSHAKNPGPFSLKIIAHARTSDGTPVFNFVVKR